jgi:serine/threonine protein kinase
MGSSDFMKATHRHVSVEVMCERLIRSHLFSPEEVKVLENRWHQESREPANLGQFSKWLVNDQYATEFQVVLLLHGHLNHFFLDHYKILERIAKGRLGVVYRAVHRLGHIVALKVLPPSRAKDPQLLARFQHQISLACGLEHPNVVRAHHAGEANGLSYLVMEYVDGENLQEVLVRRKRLLPAEAVHIVYQAFLGLQYLFEHGLVHGNLEPANLMVTPFPAEEPKANSLLSASVKILDISMGRSVLDEATSSAANDPRLTFEGHWPGCPDYLAPEQARDIHACDIRSDIYSLGCILYHALTGSPPYPDSSPLGKMIRHATDSPRSLHEFDPELPNGLQQVIDWMMAKDPEQRYSTPSRAAEALQFFLLPEKETVASTVLPFTNSTSPASPSEFPPTQRDEANPKEKNVWEFPAPGTSSDNNPSDDNPGYRMPSAKAHNSTEISSPLVDSFSLVLGAIGLVVAQIIGWLIAWLAS